MSSNIPHSASLTNHNSAAYAKNANFVYSAQYTSAVLGLLDAKPGERIADLGCGTGELTLQIKEIVGATGEVVGCDSSQSMLDKAQQNASGKDIQFHQVDIQDLPAQADPSLKGSFDAVFSSAVFHWCKRDPAGVVAGIKWLLKPAVHEVLRQRGVDPLPLDPWYFPTAEQYISLLEQGGLVPGEVGLYPRPTALPSDIVGWLETFGRNTFFASFSKTEQDEMMAQVQEICRPGSYWTDANPGMGVKADGSAKSGWQAMYVRLRGTATKPNQDA